MSRRPSIWAVTYDGYYGGTVTDHVVADTIDDALVLWRKFAEEHYIGETKPVPKISGIKYVDFCIIAEDAS